MRLRQRFVVEHLQAPDPALLLVDPRRNEAEARDRAIGDRPSLPFAFEGPDEEERKDLRRTGGRLEDDGQRPGPVPPPRLATMVTNVAPSKTR